MTTDESTTYLFLEEIPSQSMVGGVEEGIKEVKKKLEATKGVMGSEKKDVRVEELEQQLVIAETRCDTLKQQLDYMKMLYEGIDDEKGLVNDPCQISSVKRDQRQRIVTADGDLKCREGCKCERREDESDMTSKSSVCVPETCEALNKPSTGRHAAGDRKSRTGGRKSKSARSSKRSDRHGIDVLKQPLLSVEAYDPAAGAALVIKRDPMSKLGMLRPDVDADISIPDMLRLAMECEHGEPCVFDTGGEDNSWISGSKRMDNTGHSKTLSHKSHSKTREDTHQNPDSSAIPDKIIPAPQNSNAVVEIPSEISNLKACGDNDNSTKLDKCKPKTVTSKTQKVKTEEHVEHPKILQTGKTDKLNKLNCSSDSELQQIHERETKSENIQIYKPKTSRELKSKSLNKQFGSADSISVREIKKAKPSDKKQKLVGPYTNKMKGKRRPSEDLISVASSRIRNKRNKPRSSNTRSIVSRAENNEKTCSSKIAKRTIMRNESAHISVPLKIWQPDKVVELYHNAAVKTDTDTRVSDESFDVRESRQFCSRFVQTATTDATDYNNKKLRCVIPQNISESYFTVSEGGGYATFDVEMEDEFGLEGEEKKGFELPTVSSKMKQVDRSHYQQRFNFRNIPFVVGKSTTPSHNLGLNIQQVLSIIKLRQVPALPMSCLCPRPGAKNACLAAHGMPRTMGFNIPPQTSRRPCSSISGRTDVPEYPENTVCHKGGQRPISGTDSRPNTARGDEYEGAMMPAEGGGAKFKCICHPKNIVNYRQILHGFLESNADHLSFLTKYPVTAGSGKSFPASAGSGRPYDFTEEKAFTIDSDGGEGQYFYSNLKGRVRELRNILRILHEDFSRLHRRYQTLQTGVEGDSIAECDAVEQLLEIEDELRSKEDEITVVMSLYREINALKEQIKALRQKTSLAATNIQSRQAVPTRRALLTRDATSSVRLIKLLRQIQQFQERLRNE